MMSKTFIASTPARGVSRGRGSRMNNTSDPTKNRPSRLTATGLPSVRRGGSTMDARPRDVPLRPQASRYTRQTPKNEEFDDNTSEQKLIHHGSYSVKSPNEKKRQQITQQANQEIADYERHKAEQQPLQFSYVGTLGGGSLSEKEARRRQIRTNANAKTDLLEKQRQAREERKKEENVVYEEQKGVARRKTESNQMKESIQDRRNRIEMKQVNDKFLRQLEISSKQSQMPNTGTHGSVQSSTDVKSKEGTKSVQTGSLHVTSKGRISQVARTPSKTITSTANISKLSNERRRSDISTNKTRMSDVSQTTNQRRQSDISINKTRMLDMSQTTNQTQDLRRRPMNAQSNDQRRELGIQAMNVQPANQRRELQPRPMNVQSDNQRHDVRSQPMNVQPANEAIANDSATEMAQDMDTLIAMFPQYSWSELSAIYEQCHSLEVTVEILTDS